jgi:hypothetical protein
LETNPDEGGSSLGRAGLCIHPRHPREPSRSRQLRYVVKDSFTEYKHMRTRNPQLKTTFWPMIGGITEGFGNYVRTLRKVDAERPARQDLVAWLIDEFHLSDKYASNVVAMLFYGPGLLETRENRCSLANAGLEILRKGTPEALYHLFDGQFIGMHTILDLLVQRQPRTLDEILTDWVKSVRREFNVGWNTSHARMQFKHRLDFSRSLGLVKKVADGYFLSEKGMAVVRQRRLDQAKSDDEAQALSHNDIEDKLRLIGEFFEFISIKRASVNDARPPHSPKLKEERHLDCLWARVINFGGKIQYAFEVQIGGSIADAIERLEMVSSFVQKGAVTLVAGFSGIFCIENHAFYVF